MVTRVLLDYVDILILSLLYQKHLYKYAVLRNYDPYFNEFTVCATIDITKLPLNAASILLFLASASFVLLNEKMGLPNF